MENKLTTLVGDIGGTNARFGLVAEGAYLPDRCRSFSIYSHATIHDAIQCYLSEFPGVSLRRASLAIATPVCDDRIQLTNGSWGFSIAQLRQQLDIDQLKVINDFTALALSIPTLSASQLHQIGGGVAVPGRPLAVIGAGTGLGVSGLIPTPSGWMPLEGEGGHVTLGGTTPRECALFQTLWAKFGHMSAERLISGMAMIDVHGALSALDGREPEPLLPDEITARASDGSCPVCVEVMELFYGWLGVVSGNLALTLGARGGVYVGGGIIPRLLEPFEQSSFRQRFEERGRYSDYLRAIPAYVITADDPALAGAACALDTAYGHLGINQLRN